jgi:hypothetical protein
LCSPGSFSSLCGLHVRERLELLDGPSAVKTFTLAIKPAHLRKYARFTLAPAPLKSLMILASFCLRHNLWTHSFALQLLVVFTRAYGNRRPSSLVGRDPQLQSVSAPMLHQRPELHFSVGRGPAVHTCPLRLVASPLPTRLLQTCWALAVSSFFCDDLAKA